jgi:hypothetical protein
MSNVKIFANTTTVSVTIYLLIGLGLVFIKNQSFADLIAQVAFFYVAIAAFNKVVLGVPTLWHKL